jgi:8-oxo-dGTP pyrophosphatase MutT (NUDIX family)
MSAPAENVPRIGGVVLLRDDGAALLQLRDNIPTITAAGLWVFPGGHCEDGETCRDCARRECREETGYDCPELKPLTEFKYVAPENGRTYWLSFWQARYDGFSPVACFEGQEVRFIPRVEIAAKPTPEYLTAVWDLALADARKR